jgi:copper chaperone CopZ
MFNLFKKKSLGTTITLKLDGLHCSSCSLNIDSEIEEMPGVLSVSTSYAKQESVISYDPKLVDPTKFTPVIEGLGYKLVK